MTVGKVNWTLTTSSKSISGFTKSSCISVQVRSVPPISKQTESGSKPRVGAQANGTAARRRLLASADVEGFCIGDLDG